MEETPESPSGAGDRPRPASGGSTYQRPYPVHALVFTGWYTRSSEDGDIHYATPEALVRLDRGDSASGSDLFKVIAECGAAFGPVQLRNGDYWHPSFPADPVCRQCLKAANAT